MAASPARRARRPLYTLFAANVISLTGNQLATLAIPWFVLSTTGSATLTGITAAAAILPVVVAAFFGGTLVDRMGFKRTSIVADVASGATVALIPLLWSAGLLPFWALLALVFLGALLDAPGATAREALVPELIDAAGMTVERASAMIQIVERSARLVGAPIAGLLIAVLGPQHVLWLDAASFGVSALLVAAAVPRQARHPREPGGKYLAELGEGLAFVRRDSLTLVLVATLVITNFLDAAKTSVVMPVFAQQVYGSAVPLGLIFGVSAGASVLGALIYGAIGHRYSRRWVFAIAFVAVSLPSLVLAWLPPLPVVLAVQALAGLASGPLNPILSAIQYERVPAALRGRVFGTITAGAYMAMPLGVLLGGIVVDGAGLQNALVVIGASYLATTSTLLFLPALRDMDRRPTQQPA